MQPCHRQNSLISCLISPWHSCTSLPCCVVWASRFKIANLNSFWKERRDHSRCRYLPDFQTCCTGWCWNEQCVVTVCDASAFWSSSDNPRLVPWPRFHTKWRFCCQGVKEEELARLFRRFPGMEYCDLKKDKKTGKSKVSCCRCGVWSACTFICMVQPWAAKWYPCKDIRRWSYTASASQHWHGDHLCMESQTDVLPGRLSHSFWYGNEWMKN